MSDVVLEFQRGAVHLPALGLWLDAHDRRTGPERVFVSHAHSDHIGRHREVILTRATARLMQDRLGGRRVEHVLEYGQVSEFKGPGAAWRVILLPAGHILGSAMAWVESEGGSLLYTGDFKLRQGLSSEACEPRPADALVMETTFGRPHYVFPPAGEIMAAVVRFCRETLADGATPVLIGYSLGKSQEVLRRLGEAGLSLVAHEQILRAARIYAESGQELPPAGTLGQSPTAGCVVLCPPGTNALATLREQTRVRTAVLTGWAMDPGCQYRYGADAAFALSDHADFPELIELVRQVAPRRVYTVHGFAAEFARTLRELGWDARALGVEEQLDLGLRLEPGTRPVGNRRRSRRG